MIFRATKTFYLLGRNFVGRNYLSGKILITFRKNRHFRPTRYVKYKKRYLKCELRHLTFPNVLGNVMASISRHWTSFKFFWEVELKTAFYRGQTRKDSYENLVCIVLTIDLKPNVIENLLLRVKVHIYWSTFL